MSKSEEDTEVRDDETMSSDEEVTEPENTETDLDETEPNDKKTSENSKKKNQRALFKKLQPLWQKYLKNKKITIPLTIAALLLLLLLIPFTRYQILGIFIKKNFTVSVVDSTTGRPVSSAAITLAGQQAQTDNDGKATLHVKVGTSTLKTEKNYYNSSETSVTVTLSDSKNNTQVELVANGRSVPVSVMHKITSQPLSNATIKAANTEVKTTADGKALIVLPVGEDTINATVTLDGYNPHEVVIKVTDQEIDSNKFTLTPEGKVYFLSKKSGKYDVVKTNLDGTGRKVVVGGTGKEDSGTQLIASRDWRYLVLHSRRDSPSAKLYLIDTTTDKMSVIDEGNASFSLVGWSEHRLVYLVYRNNVAYWKSKNSALKSFDADSKTLTIIDENQAVGTEEYDSVTESFVSPRIAQNEIVYAKWWGYSYYEDKKLKNKQSVIIAVNADGSNKRTLQAFQPTKVSYMETYQMKPKDVFIYVALYQSGDEFETKPSYYSYKSGSFQQESFESENDFYNEVNNADRMLSSPNNKNTFWYEGRDGKNTFFMGNDNGDNPKEFMVAEGYIPFGWYTDDYLLVTLKESELYILSRDGGNMLKFTDFQQSAGSYPGYNSGYGD